MFWCNRLLCCRPFCPEFVYNCWTGTLLQVPLLSLSLRLPIYIWSLCLFPFFRFLLLLFVGTQLVFPSYCWFIFLHLGDAEHLGIYFEHYTDFIWFCANSQVSGFVLLPDEWERAHGFSFRLRWPYSSFSTIQVAIVFSFPAITLFFSYFVCARSTTSFIFPSEPWLVRFHVATCRTIDT